MRTLLMLGCIFFGASFAGEPGYAELLMSGRYTEIKPGKTPAEKAAWAFAAFQLHPGKAAIDTAREAHEAGDDLGTFVLLQCVQKGMCVKHDEKLMNKLNFELRTRIKKKKERTAIDDYIFSELWEGDENGVVHTATPDASLAEKFKDQDERGGSLARAAKAGFAQAMNDLGRACQDSEDFTTAYTWYEKAAASGLAAGLRNQAYLLHSGRGTALDQKAGFAVTVKAAEAGDVFAMINLGVFYARGEGVAKSNAEAQKWIDKAAASGHYFGALEKGLALLKGNYGYAVDIPAGKALLQKAIDTGNGEVLMKIAQFYAEGLGLELNGEKCVQFAEAAYSQGTRDAAGMPAYVYKNGLGKVQKDEALKSYWSGQTNLSLAFALNIDASNPALTARIAKIDPLTLKVE